jgi:prefoldin subunit 5
MGKIQIMRFLLVMSFSLAIATSGMAQSSEGERSDGGERNALTAKASSLVDLELVARAEQRAEALRAQLLDLEMRELDLQTRVDDLDYQLTPESIQRALAFVGSVRPMDELRDALRVRLESEKARLNKQFELLESRRGRLEAAISETDADVERLRQRLGSQ